MHAALLVLLILPVVFAQEFSCDLQYRSIVMRNGVVKGKFDYSWTRGRMKITMPPTATRPVAYTELYQYNSGKGLNGGAAPYLDQWVYRSGSSCACETGHLDSGMPMLTPALLAQYNLYTNTGNANGCTTYTRKATAVDPKVPSLSMGTTFPCSFTMEDGRSYTLTNCQAATFTDTSFTPPRDCKCGKPLDIAIVLDRSSSISKTEFLDQKGFITDFVRQFEYGPFQANLALVHFKSTAWTTLPLVQGISKANVDASVNELGCPASCDQLNGKCVPNDATTCCCCCGTSVSSGVRMGADQLATGRSIASKLLIVITDGYHNTLYLKGGVGAECGNDAAACTNDLIAANKYAFDTLGSRDKVAIYAVGVGSDRDISVPELTLIADNHPERVLRRSNFAELARNNLELIARACDENVAPCGGCCGMCICQKCFPPEACDAPGPCTNSSIVGGCCTDVNITCDSQSDKDPCHTYKCDNDPSSVSKGKCIVDKPVLCPVSNDPCIKRQCNVTLKGACESVPSGLCPENETKPECARDLDCNDNDMCTDEICSPAGVCVWTKKNATGFTGDACFEPKCISDKGWVNISKLSCDDGDICFNKTCDPVSGCVATPINCSDGNECTEDICDKNRGGCVHVPKVCNNTNGNGNGNDRNDNNATGCGVAFCEDGVCKVRAVPCVGVNIPNVIAVSAGIGTVALVGIIIAAVILCGGLAGGGVYAAAQGAGAGPMGGLQNNPIYKGDTTGGMNPLYKA